ncbi:hypothetical protein OS493_013570 [Desmophyllum pertusum]|uniref:Uncharacterized protein n=1 Tax=Desmophyllum pertusum TaxID=174260 RepID=A0A9X0A2D4_9CNID|nr:hypothetical protein OS493_013570 [Desmophyllum pertusum]
MFGVKSFGEESNSRSLINVRRSLNFDEVIKKPREPNLTDVKTEREGSASLTVGFTSEKPSHQFYSDVPMWFAKRRQQWKKQHKEGLAVDSARLCTLQANPQTPFPRPFQNVIICVATATAQSSSDVPDSLPDYLPRGREFLNPSADNKFLLFTPERVTYKAKRITFSRLE